MSEQTHIEIPENQREESEEQRLQLLEAMTVPVATSPPEFSAGKTNNEYGPALPGAHETKQPLAFLPNLMPTYKTDSSEDDDGMHMFSLVFQTPNIRQGWRPMLRGLHLKPLLVDATTISILERLGKVDWAPLPGGMKEGSSGVYCYTPDKKAAHLLKDSTNADDLEDAIHALDTMTIAENNNGDTDTKDGSDAPGSAAEPDVLSEKNGVPSL